MAGDHLRTPRGRTSRRLVLVVLLSLVVGLLAGAGASILLDPGSDDATGDRIVEAGTPPAGVAQARPEPGPITLAFVGDIYGEGPLAERLETDPAGFVGPFADVLRRADLAVGNVEAAVTTVDDPVDKEFVFRVPPSILAALRAGGLDVVSVANNHGMDHGLAGFAETLEVEAAQPDGMLIGAGADEDAAYAPFVRDVGGHRVAVIAATQVIDGDFIAEWTAQDDAPGLASAKRVDRLVGEVEAARRSADTVVVYLHWGTETEECPNAIQQELAGTLADAGADVIVGTHAHRLQGAGRLGDAFVAYGLGNFLFGATGEASAQTGVLLVEVDGRQVLGHEWLPGEIVDRVPQPLEGAEAATALSEWEARRDCTDLAP